MIIDLKNLRKKKKRINDALKEAQWQKCAESAAEKYFKYPKYSKFLIQLKWFCLSFSNIHAKKTSETQLIPY